MNLLAGRTRTYHLYLLTALEAGADFSLERGLAHGQLPSVHTRPDPDRYLVASYVESYLRQEVIVGVDRKTAAGYFDLIEDLLMATRVPVSRGGPNGA